MIYLITGVPGSGKTLYAVGELLQKLLKEKITGKDGQAIERRLLVDGIPDLLIPHEVMASRPDVADMVQVKGKETEEPEGNGLHNWWEWCQPGDVLVVDEVQRYWRPRGLGTKVPKDIAMLETHRHFGIDVVLITQNPMLVDQNVRRLVGRHLNVRRIFGGARAIIYDWDGCQTDIHRTQGASRSVWSYPKDAFKLYKSAELHTKQRQKIPLWFAFPLVVLALAIFAGPSAYSALSGSLSGKGITSAKAPASAPVAAASSPVSASGPGASSVTVAKAEPQPEPEPEPEEPAIAGCAVLGKSCRCFDKDGAALEVGESVCRAYVGGRGEISRADEAAAHVLQGPIATPTPAAELRFYETVHGDKVRRADWGRPIVPGLTPSSS